MLRSDDPEVRAADEPQAEMETTPSYPMSRYVRAHMKRSSVRIRLRSIPIKRATFRIPRDPSVTETHRFET